MNPWDDLRWEAFVLGHPNGTIFHHPAWLKVLQREYPQRAVFLACQDPDGNLFGILPLLYTRGLPLCGGRPLTGSRLSSLPRTPIAGPLAVDQSAAEELLRDAVRRTTAEHGVRLQIKAHPDERLDGVDGVVKKPWRETYVVHLPGVPGQAYTIPGGQNRATIRRGINKGINSGVRTRNADSEADLRTWYRLYLETMRRNVVAARPYRFFLALWELMRPKGMMRLLLAEHHTDAGSRIIAGHIFFTFGQTVTYAFGASRSSDFALRPNDIILWQAISDASQQGFHYLDLGEVPEGDDDLARFKSKWGAEPLRLHRYYYPDFPETPHTGSKTGSAAPINVAKRIWRHVPLSMTGWLGDRIYTYL